MSVELKDVLDAHFENGMLNIHTVMPGIVTEFNAELQTVTVQLAINKIILATGEQIVIAPVIDVPVVQMTAGGFHITLPIAKGDECLVVFSERSIDNWFIEGGTQPPAEFRHHNITDGFAIMGVNSKPNAIPEYNTTGIEIRNEEGDQRITLHPDKTIEIYTPADINILSDESNVNIDAGDNVNITAANDTNISTGNDTNIEASNNVSVQANGNISLDALKILSIRAQDMIVETSTTWVGDITMTGNVTMSGNHTINGNHTVNGTLKAGGITVNTHTHIGDSGGVTGPMQ